MIDYRKLFDYIGEDKRGITDMIGYMRDELQEQYGRLPMVEEFLVAIAEFNNEMDSWH